MKCYKTTSGCGVYEMRSCSECPYSKPKQQLNMDEFAHLPDKIPASEFLKLGYTEEEARELENLSASYSFTSWRMQTK